MKNMMKTNIMKKVEETDYIKRGKKAKDEIDEPFDNLGAMKKLEEINYSIKDIKIKELIPNVIDNVIIYVEDTMIGKEVVQDLPLNMGGISFRNWRNNKGGVFTRDVRAFIQGKTILANYAVLANKDQKLIVRFIEDEEMRIFSILKLLSGKIKDKPYMIFKKIEDGEVFTASKRYLEENTLIMHEEKIPTYIETTSHDEDGDRNLNSVSLFED